MPATLRTGLYLWKCAFVGFVLGIDAAWLLTKNTWLDMRMQTGLVIPWFVLVALLLGIYTVWRPHRLRRRVGNLSSRQVGLLTLWLAVAVPVAAAWGRWEAIAIVPAVLLRQAVHGTQPLSLYNSLLLVTLALGLPALCFDPDRCCAPQTDCNGGVSR